MALLRSDIQCKTKAWIKNLNARNAGAKNEQKSGFNKKTAIFVQRV